VTCCCKPLQNLVRTK